MTLRKAEENMNKMKKNVQNVSSSATGPKMGVLDKEHLNFYWTSDANI